MSFQQLLSLSLVLTSSIAGTFAVAQEGRGASVNTASEETMSLNDPRVKLNGSDPVRYQWRIGNVEYAQQDGYWYQRVPWFEAKFSDKKILADLVFALLQKRLEELQNDKKVPILKYLAENSLEHVKTSRAEMEKVVLGAMKSLNLRDGDELMTEQQYNRIQDSNTQGPLKIPSSLLATLTPEQLSQLDELSSTVEKQTGFSLDFGKTVNGLKNVLPRAFIVGAGVSLPIERIPWFKTAMEAAKNTPIIRTFITGNKIGINFGLLVMPMLTRRIPLFQCKASPQTASAMTDEVAKTAALACLNNTSVSGVVEKYYWPLAGAVPLVWPAYSDGDTLIGARAGVGLIWNLDRPSNFASTLSVTDVVKPSGYAAQFSKPLGKSRFHGAVTFGLQWGKGGMYPLVGMGIELGRIQKSDWAQHPLFMWNWDEFKHQMSILSSAYSQLQKGTNGEIVRPSDR